MNVDISVPKANIGVVTKLVSYNIIIYTNLSSNNG